mmetsp:Transcript_27874/g.69895  ORF Transcript_27874/g.69895 Transcript_27874/m.69895 type:complete len:202 (-) Transcript_27874:1390-1995(-)
MVARNFGNPVSRVLPLPKILHRHSVGCAVRPGSAGAGDLDLEGLAPARDRLAVGVHGLNADCGWSVAFDIPGHGHHTLGRIGSVVRLDNQGHAADRLVVHTHFNFVGAALLWGVHDVIRAVAVVFHLCGDLRIARPGDLALERLAALLQRRPVGVRGEDLEARRLARGGLEQSRPFSAALGWIGHLGGIDVQRHFGEALAV